MNTTVKSDFIGFPKVKWLQYTSKVGKCMQVIDVNFFRISYTKKSLKSVNFWQSYFKNKKVDVFLEHSVFPERK